MVPKCWTVYLFHFDFLFPRQTLEKKMKPNRWIAKLFHFYRFPSPNPGYNTA